MAEREVEVCGVCALTQRWVNKAQVKNTAH